MQERVEVNAAGESGMRMRQCQNEAAAVVRASGVIRQPQRALADRAKQKRKRGKEKEEQGAERNTVR